MAIFDFNKKRNTENQSAGSDLVKRLETFLAKLSEKADELYRETYMAAQSVADEDTDPYKRSYYQFKNGIQGQFRSILKKGDDTYRQQVIPNASIFETIKLSDVFNQWHTKILNQMTNVFNHVVEKDLEKEYQEILADYNSAKENFHCKQCGGKLVLAKIYYIATYVTCSHCQTQNTFNPSSKTRSLEHIAHDLAEQRSVYLQEEYDKIRQRSGRQAAFEAYKKYQRNVFDELNNILPGMEEPHEKFYQRLIDDYIRD